MNTNEPGKTAENQEGTPVPPGFGAVPAVELLAWEMIENGRYMPRRIRGSCLGRELG